MHGTALASLSAMTLTLFLWSLVSARFERWNISGPIVFVAVGLLLANEPVDILDIELHEDAILSLAELTLAVVLFGDAARVSLRKLRRDAVFAGRLLLVGLPLTIAAGALAAKATFPALSWAVCAVIGASVAPTDAALGAAIIDDERVPERIRRVLNVESGLNDGIATPFVEFFLVLAVAGTALQQESESRALWSLALGAVGGAVIGGLGGWLLRAARAAGIGATTYRQVAVASLAVFSYAFIVHVEGNGFVAAFVAGLAFGAVTRREPVDSGTVDDSLAFTHNAAELLSFGVWFLFGALLVPVLRDAGWQEMVFAIVALTAVRMIPVAISLVGTHFDRETVGVIGWFGPRGLASVVFSLIAIGDLDDGNGASVMRAITATVVLSVVLHGISAAPIAARYGARHTDARL